MVVAKARAINSKGFGLFSQPNIFGARISQQPIIMQPPRLDKVSSTLTTISLEWDPLTTGEENGGSLVDSYNLQWDAGTNEASWLNVQG